MSDGILYYNLEQVSILGRTLYIVGWARDLTLRISLDGQPVPFLSERVERPDVAVCFNDPAAASWGFVLVALIPNGRIELSKLTLQIAPDVILTDPVRNRFALEDQPAISMINGFLDTVKANKGSLLEIGSRARSGITYRSLFPDDVDYIGLDIAAGPNVDVVGDAHEMSKVIHRQFDFIFSISVFEHLLMPWKVAIEMNKVLCIGGLAYIGSHSTYPLHDEPWDFWRYSKEAWSGIFNAHTGFELVRAAYAYPAYIVPCLISEPGRAEISTNMNYLNSACVVRKTGNAIVSWDARTADVYNLNYSHGAAR